MPELVDPYSPEQIETLIEQFKGTGHHLFILLLCRTGCRVGEAITLEWNDIDLKNRRMSVNKTLSRRMVTKTKTGKERDVDLTPTMVKALRKAKLRATGELVFSNKTGGHINPNNFRKRIYYPACEAAGLHRTRLHDLRHTPQT